MITITNKTKENQDTHRPPEVAVLSMGILALLLDCRGLSSGVKRVNITGRFVIYRF